jgi:23S rRNA pseudouridine1911/1915/1917 synthase
VKVILHTGRTHQIRVHFAWLKHPVAGDTVYGYRKARLSLQRQFLHAHRLRLRLPSTGEEREFVAPLPDDLTQLLASLGADSSDG